MQILVITSCTGKKAFKPPNALKVTDFEKGKDHIFRREEELSEFMRPAHDMYTGPQHIKLMRGIRESFSPNSIDLQILSAGYGLIPGGQAIAPYNCTFAKMKVHDLRKWADELNVPTDFRRVVARQYDLGILLLGDKYMRACDIDDTVQFNNTTIAFCAPPAANRLNSHTFNKLRIVPLPVSKNDHSLNAAFSCTNDALKGELGARLLKSVFGGILTRSQLADPGVDLLEELKKVRP